MGKLLDERELDLIKRLVDRLERLSADSTYAHRASGIRGSLLNYMECIESGEEVDHDELEHLLEYTFDLLRQAAEEIGGRI